MCECQLKWANGRICIRSVKTNMIGACCSLTGNATQLFPLQELWSTTYERYMNLSSQVISSIKWNGRLNAVNIKVQSHVKEKSMSFLWFLEFAPPPKKNCSSYSKVSGSLTLKKGNYYNIVTTGMNIYSIIPFPDLWNIHKLKTNKEEIHKWKHISRKINFKVG